MGHKRHKFRGSFENQAPGLTGPGITEPDYPAHMPDMMNGKPVIISLDHPENNPTGVTVEEFTEEVPRDSFGINVGQQMEDLLKAHAAQQSNHTKPNKKEETKMEDNKNTTINPNNETNKQEESKMNEETKVNTKAQNNATNQEQPKADPKVEPNTKKEESKVDPKDVKQDAPKEEPKKDTPKEEQEDRPDPNKQAPRERHTTSLAREAGSAFTVGASYGMGVIVGMAAGAAIVYGVKKIFCGNGEAGAETASDTVSNLF